MSLTYASLICKLGAGGADGHAIIKWAAYQMIVTNEAPEPSRGLLPI